MNDTIGITGEGVRPHISTSSAVWKIIAPVSDVSSDYETLRKRLISLFGAVHLALSKRHYNSNGTMIPFRMNINGDGKKTSLDLHAMTILNTKRESTIVISFAIIISKFKEKVFLQKWGRECIFE